MTGISCRLNRYVGSSNTYKHNLNAEGHTYLYFHLNTCIAGRTWIIWSYTGEEFQV